METCVDDFEIKDLATSDISTMEHPVFCLLGVLPNPCTIKNAVDPTTARAMRVFLLCDQTNTCKNEVQGKNQTPSSKVSFSPETEILVSRNSQ